MTMQCVSLKRLSESCLLTYDNPLKQLSDSSGEGDSYFADPDAAPAPRHQATFRTDEQGYVIRRSVLEEGTRPEYIIPVGSADGAWGMLKRVGRFRGEGWLALWKGASTLASRFTHISQVQYQVCLLLRPRRSSQRVYNP